jgi:hypothetical protein
MPGVDQFGSSPGNTTRSWPRRTSSSARTSRSRWSSSDARTASGAAAASLVLELPPGPGDHQHGEVADAVELRARIAVGLVCGESPELAVEGLDLLRHLVELLAQSTGQFTPAPVS